MTGWRRCHASTRSTRSGTEHRLRALAARRCGSAACAGRSYPVRGGRSAEQAWCAVLADVAHLGFRGWLAIDVNAMEDVVVHPPPPHEFLKAVSAPYERRHL